MANIYDKIYNFFDANEIDVAAHGKDAHMFDEYVAALGELLFADAHNVNISAYSRAKLDEVIRFFRDLADTVEERMKLLEENH